MRAARRFPFESRWLRRTARIAAALCVLACGAAVWVAIPPPTPRVAFPGGRTFAFTIVDDTDMATLERLRPVYEVLERYGLRTTKTVWVASRAADSSNDADFGDALDDPAYRAFIVDLQEKGFEIGLHGVRGGSSLRADTLRGLADFRSILGHDPKIQVNHSLNQDNLYWGAHLYALAPLRWAARMSLPYDFSGHDERSPYFWGDAAREHVQYVRRFTFREVNLLAVNPEMPYRLAATPYVNYWFSTSDGDGVIKFTQLLSDENLDRLEREGGVCLVYAHLGAGSFNMNGGVDPRYEERIRAIADRNGWFVPASQILDYLRAQPGWTGDLGLRQQVRLDMKFVLQHFGL